MVGYFYTFLDHQNKWGIVSITSGYSNIFSFEFFKEFTGFIFNKLLFLLSAREAVGINNSWIAGTSLEGISENIFDFEVMIKNIIPAIFLFTINVFGLISIFIRLNKRFKYAFLFSLIPLIPVLSYPSHHRYFLPYTLVTSACAPLLFFRKTKS